jgi:hypothetical protein
MMDGQEMNVVETVAPEADNSSRPSARGSAGIWLLLLALVVLFGYLTAARRDALGKFAEQIADIVRDFRGYDPEF